ncbi:hypothetical protein HYW53_02770 [Candidatus Giovannonibacteria bacterium]|nr:hypothetical protein [Candidatus Giovannonibacteria bacterium]
MPWRRRKSNAVLWLIILILLGLVAFAYRAELSGYFAKIKNYFSSPAEKKNQTIEQPSEYSLAKFPKDNLKEKELDINGDGHNEIFLTSFAAKKPYAVLADARDRTKGLSEIFDFSVSAAEYDFTSEETPEVSDLQDLNSDGEREIIIDLKSYGAYTGTFGILSFASGKINWVTLKEKNGSMRPAVFQDGASVRNAEVFRVMEEAGKKVILDLDGYTDIEGRWSWEGAVYVWDGKNYAYNSALTDKFLKEIPHP